MTLSPDLRTESITDSVHCSTGRVCLAGGYAHKTDREQIPVMDTDGRPAQIDTILARRASMNHQWEREIYLIAAVLLSFGASPSRASAAECAQSAIQAISPSNTMIVSATPQSDR